MRVVLKPQTLIEYLIEHYPESPRSRIKKMLQNGSVLVNGKQTTLHSFRLEPGDKIEINTHFRKAGKSTIPFSVLYEDNYIIVVDKPAGYPTYSTDGSRSIEMVVSEALAEQTKGKIRAFVVHRLDKEVSGVLLMAKSQEIMDAVKNRWKETEKHYYALVQGIPEKNEGTIKSWLAEDRQQKVYTTHEEANAKFAVTHYRLIKREGNCSLLDVQTDTGRKNQIRVHLSDMGCPIVGDRKYGAKDEFKRRVRLHACSLRFPHPVSGETITVTSPMPRGFLSLKPGDEKYK